MIVDFIMVLRLAGGQRGGLRGATQQDARKQQSPRNEHQAEKNGPAMTEPSKGQSASVHSNHAPPSG